MQTSQVVDKVQKKVNQFGGSPRTEGAITKMVEQQTAKIPSISFLMLGFGSIGLSLALRMAGKGKAANFVGLWTPTILIMGLYNKLVKVEGSERSSV